MNILTIAMLVFGFIELINIIVLYTNPGTQVGNGVGVFNAFEESKKYPDIHHLIKYLIYWVAGTKLIFFMLILVIVFTGRPTTQFFAVCALIISILSFFWRLYPMIKDADLKGQITPKGYSKALFFMIFGFVVCFIAVGIVWIL